MMCRATANGDKIGSDVALKHMDPPWGSRAQRYERLGEAFGGPARNMDWLELDPTSFPFWVLLVGAVTVVSTIAGFCRRCFEVAFEKFKLRQASDFEGISRTSRANARRDTEQTHEAGVSGETGEMEMRISA
ncbi:hypothetical protein V8C42DRAFT_339391 [Trichoderma barbatum]